KDYIAMPKPNMYQSLHTTIVSGNGNFYEIQIRTKEMDEVAEVGVAAHWAYKENSGYNSRREQQEIEDKLHWFRDFVSATNESAESADFSNISRDIFEANVYVFTPKGKVIELPNGSTPVDFAYRIHTKVGDSTTGALVNGVLVPLNTVLKTGDMVEIKTSKNSPGPSEGWLSFVRSAQAKNCIRKFIAKKNADVLRIEKIAKGRQSCLDAFKDRGIDEPDMMELIDSPKVLNYFHFDNIEDLFIGVTNRKPIPAAILEFLKIKKQVSLNVLGGQKRIAPSNTPVYCRGGGSRLAISLANCCTPIPGDDIVGYITKGKGISVHRKTCPNVAKEENRLINVYWRSDIETSTYPVDVYIEANDRPSLLVDILSTLSVAKVSASSLHASTNNTNFVVTITCTLMVSDAKRLSDIFNIVQNVPGVFRVTRMIH
ncbi:MAG: TGS domain-containing protein, partial [Bacilli bacterium]